MANKIKMSKKSSFLVGLIVVVIVLGGGYTYVHHRNKTSTPTPQRQAQQVAASDAEAKKKLVESDTNPTSNDKQGNPTESTPTPGDIQLTAKQESNSSVTVLTKLNNYSNGTCKLTVTNGSKTASQTAAVTYQPEFSSCAGFSVPTSDLGTGNWKIGLSVTTNGKSKSNSINFEVK